MPKPIAPTSSTIVTGQVQARLRALTPSLQPSDARVAQAVLANPELAIYLSVDEMAEAAATSTATVVRCAKKCGFKGYHDLKLALAQELAAFKADDPEDDGDPRTAVVRQVTRAGAQTVRDAGVLVDAEVFQATVDTIAAARVVLFAGVGTSAPLAQDAAYRFAAIGLQTHAPADVHVQHVKARQLVAEDACIVVSHTGQTRETLAVAEAAQAAGAQVVVITSFARSPLTKLADHVILAGTREVAFRLEAVASRLAHLAMLDALLVAVAGVDDNRTQAALALYSDALSEHRL